MIEYLKKVEAVRLKQLEAYREASKDEQAFLVVQSFADDTWDLMVACLSNYETVEGEFHKAKPMQDVIETLKELIANAFLQNTGRGFRPSHVRE